MIDTYSETWRAVEAWAAGALARAREDLERETVTDERARVLRGRIAVLKELLQRPDDERAAAKTAL